MISSLDIHLRCLGLAIEQRGEEALLDQDLPAQDPGPETLPLPHEWLGEESELQMDEQQEEIEELQQEVKVWHLLDW